MSHSASIVLLKSFFFKNSLTNLQIPKLITADLSILKREIEFTALTFTFTLKNRKVSCRLRKIELIIKSFFQINSQVRHVGD